MDLKQGQIIGFYSPAPCSGKSTACSFLATEGYTTTSFARTLKEMVGVLLKHLGYSEDNVKRLLYKDKHELIPEIGVTARYLMQTLGTEWGRKLVHPDLWVICWRKGSARSHTTVEDVRYPNEAQAVLEEGGVLVRLENKKAQEDYAKVSSGHTSEQGLEHFTFDINLDNNGSLEEFYRTLSSTFFAEDDYHPRGVSPSTP